MAAFRTILCEIGFWHFVSCGIETKRLDGGDRHLRKAVAYKAIQVMRRWERERRVVRKSKIGTAIVWQSLNL